MQAKNNDFIPLAEPKITEQDCESVLQQLQSSFVGPGNAAGKFGDEIANLCHREFCVPVCSGTVALSTAAMALGLSPGDEILIPNYGVLSVINAFASIGLKPRLVDISSFHGCIDPQKLEDSISPRTKAVCFVSFLGNIGKSLADVSDICKRQKIPLIEDAAWSLFRGQDGKVGGSFGDIAVTSFSVPKLITTGQGGAVLTDFPDIRDKVVRLIDQGGTQWRRTGNIESIGSNLRMSDLNAALGLSQLATIKERFEQKQKVFLKINEIMEGKLVCTEDQLFPTQNVILVHNKDAVVSKLRKLGIGAAIQYSLYNKLKPYEHLHCDSSEGGNFWDKYALYLPFGVGSEMDAMVRMARDIMKLNLDYLRTC